MFRAIGAICLGILSILFGILNMRGDLPSVHWYIRQRLTEEDKDAYGKKVGFSAVICGISYVTYSVFSLLAEKLQNDLLLRIGAVVMIGLLIIGLAIGIYVLIKYNKGFLKVKIDERADILRYWLFRS